MADELIDIFDENNRPLGIRAMKSEAHKKGLWHRSVHIWIYNSRGEVLLQKRNKDKNLFPDMWDISVAGHVGAGEKPAESAVREIREEIGIEVGESQLVPVREMKVSISSNGLQNNELIYVFLLRYDGGSSRIRVQKEELQDARFFLVDFVRKDYKATEGKYTPDLEYWLWVLDTIEKQVGAKPDGI